MRLPALFVFGVLLSSSFARADVYIAELAPPKCAKQAKVDLKKYRNDSMGDKNLEVSHERTDGDREPLCGEKVYVRNTTTRKRWVAFPTKEGCECYLRSAQVLDTSK